MQNKYLKLFIIILAIAIITPQITLAAWWNPFSWGWVNRIFHFQQTTQKQEKLIGGDKDSQGCLIAAGYSWCEAKTKCLRTWEEPCEIVQTAGWKTYNNYIYNYQLKYPSNWLINTTEDVAFGQLPNHNPDIGGVVWFKNHENKMTAAENADQIGLVLTVLKKGNVLLPNYSSGGAFKKININGSDAFRASIALTSALIMHSGTRTVVSVYIERGTDVFEFEYTANPNYSNLNTEADGIINSFTLL